MESSEEIRAAAESEHEGKPTRTRAHSDRRSKGGAAKSAGDAGEKNAVEEKTETDSNGEPVVHAPSRAAVVRPPQSLASRVVVNPREQVELSLRTLLGAGVHFGHQTSRWNPAMAPFIHSTRNGIHIINLPKTVQAWLRARRAVVDLAANGGKVLFVGTKKQAQGPIMEEAIRCGAFYVSQRWLGGMITNFQTVRKSIERMKKVETILIDEEQLALSGQTPKFTKKERLMMVRELEKLDYSLGGIKEMTGLPDLLFVVDINLEEIAVREARRANIPVVALVDTNCSPSMVDYAIPSNDDGTRAIRLFAAAIADAVMEGRQLAAQRGTDSRKGSAQAAS